MTLHSTNLDRYDWLKSQADWHDWQADAALTRTRRLWHLRQRRHYQNEIQWIPGIMSLIISRTFRRLGPQIAEAVGRNNALISRLQRQD